MVGDEVGGAVGAELGAGLGGVVGTGDGLGVTDGADVVGADDGPKSTSMDSSAVPEKDSHAPQLFPRTKSGSQALVSSQPPVAELQGRTIWDVCGP